MLSAYTNNPINLAINSPASEGKSWDIHKVGDNFEMTNENENKIKKKMYDWESLKYRDVSTTE